jgi:pilus assembly protein Flp/PilA
MLSLYVRLQNLLKSEKGQGMVEYSLIIGLVVIAVIGAVATLGGQVKAIFDSITNTLTQKGY